MENKQIEIRHLYVGYEDKTVISDLSFDVLQNDFFCINGPNGSGKTTLIKALLGLLPVKSGSIRFFREGKIVTDSSIGYLPQISLIDRKFPISVHDAVLFGLFGNEKRKPTAADKQKVKDTIAKVGLSPIEKEPIGKLSGGQLQRVLFARTIIASPEILILDEPDVYMDQSFKGEMIAMLEEINKQTAVLLVSHHPDTFSPLIKHELVLNR